MSPNSQEQEPKKKQKTYVFVKFVKWAFVSEPRKQV